MKDFYKNREELQTINPRINALTNDEIGDIIGFAEVVAELQQDDKLTFTLDMDRDRELADLYRFCMAKFLEDKGDLPCFADYVRDLLLEMEEGRHESFMTDELCVKCGKHIELKVPYGTECIPFCPHCGKKHITLCTICAEKLNGCRPKHAKAFCKGNPNWEF